jgi:hypothetical protein
MPRTTVNLDASILRQLRLRQHKERKAQGELINQLLARALAETETAESASRPLRWTSRAMGSRVDLEDRDALYDVLDRS